jgi:hypothetical protein
LDKEEHHSFTQKDVHDRVISIIVLSVEVLHEHRTGAPGSLPRRTDSSGKGEVEKVLWFIYKKSSYKDSNLF